MALFPDYGKAYDEYLTAKSAGPPWSDPLIPPMQFKKMPQPSAITQDTWKVISPVSFQVRKPDGSVWAVQVASKDPGSLPMEFVVWLEHEPWKWSDDPLTPLTSLSAATQANGEFRVKNILWHMTCVQPAVT